MFRFVVMMLLLLFMQSVLADAQVQKSQNHQFISISDIHFDPLAGCERYQSTCPIVTELNLVGYQAWDAILEKYSNNQIKYYQNTNYVLLKSSLTELKQLAQQKNPQFVLVLGDFLDHNLKKSYRKFSRDKSNQGYADFVKKTMQYLTYKINQAFPFTDVYPALGNVDGYGDDYRVVPQGEFLKDMVFIWSTLIKNKNDRASFIKTFGKAGYYAVEITPATKLIVLDTVLFSPRSQSIAVKEAAREQLTWLKYQLSLAKQYHQTVLIACHIPVGIDIYLSSTMPYKIIKNFWLEEYTKEFLTIVKEFSNEIVGILSGHVHVDLFQFMIEGKDNHFIPMIFTPSISPIFGNNPAIKVFNYENETLRLQNFERYYKPLSHASQDWHRGSRFNSIYQSDCKYCYLTDVIQHLVMNNYILDFFTKYYAGYYDVESDENDWRSFYWCGIYSNDARTLKNCLNK